MKREIVIRSILKYIDVVLKELTPREAYSILDEIVDELENRLGELGEDMVNNKP